MKNASSLMYSRTKNVYVKVSSHHKQVLPISKEELPSLGSTIFRLPRCTRAIPKSTSDWLIKKIQHREQNFTIWNSYIDNCTTSPHSCHPHLGTCCTVTLVFVVLVKERCRQVMQPFVDSIHELFVGVEALGNQTRPSS